MSDYNTAESANLDCIPWNHILWFCLLANVLHLLTVMQWNNLVGRILMIECDNILNVPKDYGMIINFK